MLIVIKELLPEQVVLMPQFEMNRPTSLTGNHTCILIFGSLFIADNIIVGSPRILKGGGLKS